MKSRIHVQFAKFFAVGMFNTGVDWVIFFALTSTEAFVDHRSSAKAVSFLVAVVNSFILNSYWTFRNEYTVKMGDSAAELHKQRLSLFGRFATVSAIGWVANITIFTLVSAVLRGHVAPRIVDVLSLATASGVVMVWNFLLNKFWTYAAKTEGPTIVLSPQERLARWRFRGLAAALIALQLVISFFVMRGDSATTDEIAHIADGYSIVEHQDYRFNPEHPPLMKIFAGASLHLLPLNDITHTAGWDKQNQWDAGRAFLYFIGNDADRMLFVARLPMLLLLVVLGMYVARFAAELFGRKVALVVLTLFAFSPELLAHGHLVTTDVASALGFVGATYYFWHFLQERTWKSLVIAGMAFGVAQLLKFSCILLVPIDIALVFVWCLMQQRFYGVAFWKNLRTFVWQCVLIGGIGLALVWAVYIPCVWNTPVAVEHVLIDRFITYDAFWVPTFRSVLHTAAENPITAAVAHYAMGLYMVVQRVEGGNSTFILGQFDEKTIWWFFPVAWIMKTALPVLVLFFVSLGIVAMGVLRKPRMFTRLWRYALLVIPLGVYWVVTMLGSLNLGIRHLMPTVPFVLLLCGEAITVLLARKRYALVLVFLMGWMVVSVSIAYPHYLGYFNELSIGIPKYELLVDSSLDWGQDLKRLVEYVDEQKIDHLYVDYFGGGQIEYYLPNMTAWHSSDGPVTGYLAVSTTFYQFSRFYGEKEGKWSYDWLREFTPIVSIGDSILVFHITPEELRRNPPVSPYPIVQPPLQYLADPNNFLSQ